MWPGSVQSWAMRVVPQLPRALWWDHNAHYHRWLLGQLPAAPERVLEAGCGAGVLAARIAERAGRVDAVDLSGDLLDPGLPLDPAGYDVVTALSSLHHLPLRPGLARLAGLLRPGGVLVIVGLYRNASAAEYAFEAIRQPANAAVGVVMAARGRAGQPHDAGMPVRPAEASWTEITAAARDLIPGAWLRRRFFWRYSLLWHRPMPSQKASELPVTPV